MVIIFWIHNISRSHYISFHSIQALYLMVLTRRRISAFQSVQLFQWCLIFPIRYNSLEVFSIIVSTYQFTGQFFTDRLMQRLYWQKDHQSVYSCQLDCVSALGVRISRSAGLNLLFCCSADFSFFCVLCIQQDTIYRRIDDNISFFILMTFLRLCLQLSIFISCIINNNTNSNSR